MENIFEKIRNSFFLIAGPCVIENYEVCFHVAEKINEICNRLNIPYIFKSSFDKANRSSISSYRGPGLERGLKVLSDISDSFKIPVTTDVHETQQVKLVAEHVDIIQIPAFLCRQTDLLVEAGKTGKTVNVKKGQFLSGNDMENVISKLEYTGNKKIIITERGNMFGYNNLVVDMRNFPILKRYGYPVVFDATHSVQTPGGLGKCSGGDRNFVPFLANSAVAAGANGIFMEVHPEPDKALCDGANSIYLKDVEIMIKNLLEIYNIVKNQEKKTV